jgi:hypothetical protein
VARIWRDYSVETALWSWRNDDLLVWMTFDAVDALRLAAMAASIRAGEKRGSLVRTRKGKGVGYGQTR